MNKEVKGILLPTKENGYAFIKESSTGRLSFKESCNSSGNLFVPQHLYIVDESAPIKEGNWFITQKYGLQKCTSVNQHQGATLLYFEGNFCSASLSQKVLTTTDPKLIVYGVASISDEFLQEYVKAQGRGNIAMEYEEWPSAITGNDEHYKKNRFYYIGSKKQAPPFESDTLHYWERIKLDSQGNAVLSILTNE